MNHDAIFEAPIQTLAPLYRGKVRDIFVVDDEHMLIVTTDRLSAFDVILPDPIPRKGVVLTAVSNFWFHRFQNLIKNHLTDIALEDALPNETEREWVAGRSVIVKRLKPLPLEAIVRGYIIGSGWKDYQATGAVSGLVLPSGLQQAEQLSEPLFTPSTKAELGGHDENIDYAKAVDLVGAELAQQIQQVSIDLYRQAAEYALSRGIIIADTKFEFGLDENDELVLMDEILTPDSSRFWPLDSYQTGISPPSFDKQYVRDYLETLDWDKTDPGPHLPPEVIANTAEKYQEAFNRLVLES